VLWGDGGFGLDRVLGGLRACTGDLGVAGGRTEGGGGRGRPSVLGSQRFWSVNSVKVAVMTASSMR